VRADAELRIQEEYSVSGLGGSFGVTLAWRPAAGDTRVWEVSLWEEVLLTYLFGLLQRRERRSIMQLTNLPRLCVGRERYRELQAVADRMAAEGLEPPTSGVVGHFGYAKPLDGEGPVFHFREQFYQLDGDGKPRRMAANPEREEQTND